MSVGMGAGAGMVGTSMGGSSKLMGALAYPNHTLPGNTPRSLQMRLSSLIKHHRNGSTDRLGLRSFDAAVFEKPPIRFTEERRELPALPVMITYSLMSFAQFPAFRHTTCSLHTFAVFVVKK
ncbi:hypothetical protein C8R48DRAFT_767102 [Suillus tomentosus]|nr:hypothetical protein C8R48DRAFT_767102 [Suillus tomentosus]